MSRVGGDIIKRIHRALDGRHVPFKVFEPRDGAQLEGVLRQKGLHDELSGEPYAVIETARDQAVYVRLDQTTAASLKEGDRVLISCEREPWLKATDEVLQREAASNGGIYSPTVHLQRLRQRPLAINGQSVRPEDVIEANCRRLDRLARYKLASPRPDGTWVVPPNLVDTLRQREQSHPRFRFVDQLRPPELPTPARRRGPSLDR